MRENTELHISRQKIRTIIALSERAISAELRALDGVGVMARVGREPADLFVAHAESAEARALDDCIMDLSHEELASLVGLYCYGRGDFETVGDAVSAAMQATDAREGRDAYIAGRVNLARCLKMALRAIESEAESEAVANGR